VEIINQDLFKLNKQHLRYRPGHNASWSLFDCILTLVCRINQTYLTGKTESQVSQRSRHVAVTYGTRHDIRRIQRAVAVPDACR